MGTQTQRCRSLGKLGLFSGERRPHVALEEPRSWTGRKRGEKYREEKESATFWNFLHRFLQSRRQWIQDCVATIYGHHSAVYCLESVSVVVVVAAGGAVGLPLWRQPMKKERKDNWNDRKYSIMPVLRATLSSTCLNCSLQSFAGLESSLLLCSWVRRLKPMATWVCNTFVLVCLVFLTVWGIYTDSSEWVT